MGADMPASNAIRAGRAFVELFLDDSRLKKGIRGVTTTLRSVGAGTTALGAGLFAAGSTVAAGMLAAVKQTTDMGSAMADMSQRTGVSVEALSQLGYAAAQSDADMGELQLGLTKMQKTIAEAADGNDKAAEQFKSLGLSISDLQNQSPEEAFLAIVRQQQALGNESKQTLSELAVFGKGVAALRPLLNEGADGIARLMKRADELGLTMSREDAQAAEAFGDQMDSLWSVLKMGVFNIGSALVPELSALVKWITGNAVAAGKWIKENRGLFASIAKLAAGAMAVGAALMAAGAAMTALGFTGAAISSAFAAVGAAIGTLASVFGLLLSPVVLVGGAIVAVGGYFAYQSGIIGQAAEYLGGVFGTLKNDAMIAFGGIKDALAGGDFALAAKIVWATLRLEFGRGIAWLEGIWLDFTGFFQRIWTDAVFAIAGSLTNAWASVQTAWNEVTGFMSDAWTVFTGFVVDSWNSAFAIVQKAWVHLKSLFDDTLNVKAEVEKIDQESSARKKGIQDTQDKAIGQSDAARRNRNAEIEANRKGALEALDSDHGSKRSAREAARLKKDAEIAAEIERLTAERNRLAEKAGRAVAGLPNSDSEGGDGPKKPPKMPKVPSASSIGTFSSEAAGRIGGNSPLSQIASSTKKTEDNTKEGAKQGKRTADNLNKLKGMPVVNA